MSQEPQFQFTSLSQQLARARSGSVTQWMVERVIVKGGSTLLYAPSGNGKSLVVMDLAVAASHGRKWLGVHDLGEPFPILYLDDDGNNDNEFNARLIAFGAEDTNVCFDCLLHSGFQITNEAHRAALIQKCLDKGVQLLIIDSLTRIHRLSETSASDMKIVNAAIKEFCQSGITVVVLHHSTKGGKAYRGSGEIAAGFDGVLRMEKISDNSFILVNEKVRSVAESGIWEGCTIVTSKDADGRLVLDGSQPLPSKTKETKEDGWRVEVLDLLRQSDLHGTELKKALKLSGRDYEAFDALLAALQTEGLISPEKRGKATYYQFMGEDDEEDDGE